MEIVTPAPDIMMAPPRSQDAPYWTSLLRNLFGVFSSHASAINLLWENLELDTEYLIPNRTVQGLPVYIQRFSPITGVDGSGGFATATLAHGISTFNRGRWLVLYGSVTGPSASTAFPPSFTDPQTGNISHVFVNAINIGWRVNFDASTYKWRPILEYQKT